MPRRLTNGAPSSGGRRHSSATRPTKSATPNPENRVVTRHGKCPAHPKATLRVMAKRALTGIRAIPQAGYGPVSTLACKKNHPITVSEAGSSGPGKGQNHLPGATAKPRKFAKTP